MSVSTRSNFLSVIMPGFLVAATGVGAGDLATASFTGSQLGVAILWAVAVGGLLKYVLTEGLARWQLVTGETFIEGVAKHLGKPVGFLFLPYLLLWSFFVGSALMSACGVTLHAMIPLFENAANGKMFFGVLSSVCGLSFIAAGNFSFFERVMSVCIGVMFVVVMIMAAALWPGFDAVLMGLLVPTIPDIEGAGITWTVALIGGVGGTLTILCYGYWIREKGRVGPKDIQTCRIDLAVGYSATVMFGIAMVIIGSSISIDGKGAGLLVTLADRLEATMGVWGRWLFLVGAFSAIFSSLLGVWQAVPYLFADVWRVFVKPESGKKSLRQTKAYKIYLYAIAFIPMIGLFMSFKEVQKFYAVIGALFMPMLAIGLLVMNGRKAWMGKESNTPLTVLLLISTLAFFAGLAWMKWAK